MAVTLAVRAAGLVLAVLFLPRAISDAMALVFFAIPQAGAMGFRAAADNIVSAAWTIVVLGAAVYCFLSGRWLIRRLTAGLAGSEHRCKECGYDVSGIERGKRCPECGAVRW